MKYPILGVLTPRALQSALRELRNTPCKASVLGIATLVVIALSTGTAFPLLSDGDRAVTVDGSAYHAGVLASPLTPSPSPTPEATPTAAPKPEPTPVAVAPAGPQPSFPVVSSAVTIWEANCGTMLYSKNPDARLAPASLTKMMTLLVSLESRDYPLNIVRPGISAVELKQRTRSSVMGLSPEMAVTLQDLYMGLMLPSGNDAAIALAQASGNYDAFVERMNARAVELGLSNTHFSNPHGLDDPQLYSTARDLLVLERVMLEHPYAAWVVGTPYYTTVHGTLGFNNGNKLLTGYRGTIGGKTGFTNDAGHTIAVTVVRGGRRLDMVVLGSNVKFEEPMRLLDWAFNETQPSC